MDISAFSALVFLPFVLPICIYVTFSDMRDMRIPNQMVVLLFLVFAVVGLVALPFDVYLWRYIHLIVVLVAGIALNAGGVMGAGDAKFAAAANSEGWLGRVLDYTEEPVVSSDFIGYHASSTVDGLSTDVMGDNLVKVVTWYDNEWGYSVRLADLAAYVAERL